jgi:predicted nucleic acid-binding protein
MRYGITVYDSLFLAQAKSLKAKLVTGDKRKGRVAKEIGVDANLIE